jgi:hypothetical protein
MPSAKVHSASGDASLALGFVLQNHMRLAAQTLRPIRGVVGKVAEIGFVLQNSPNARLSYFDASKAGTVPSVFAAVHGL